MKRIALFTGGTGTASIAEALHYSPKSAVDLTLIVNCYDDGLSTGEIRKAIPGMLGPSDVRKNVSRFSRLSGDMHHMLEERINICYNQQINGMYWDLLDSELRRYFDIGCAYLDSIGASIFECAVGNIVFAGCYLSDGEKDFNRTVWLFQEECRCMVKILNVTNGENMTLAYLCDDGTCLTEGKLINKPRSVGIKWTFFGDGRIPEINPLVKSLLTDIDLIVYGPGTQHSSLLPSYMTKELMSAIRMSDAKKVYIANAGEDVDTKAGETTEQMLKKFVTAMSLNGALDIGPMEYQSLVTHVMVASTSQVRSGNLDDWNVEVRDWAIGKTGKHDGPSVANYLLSLF